MRKTGLTLAAAILAAVVLSVYLGLQFRGVLNSSFINQGLIVQMRVVRVQFMDINGTTSQDFFRFNLTFLNPTAETLRLMRVEGEYREAGGLIATVDNETSEIVNPGYHWIVERFSRYVTSYYTPSNASLGTDSSLVIRYHVKLGPNAYQMTATVNGLANQAIQTSGPFNTSYDETYSTATTYVLSIIDAWAITLEIIAVFLIAVGRSGQKIRQVTKESSHKVMLSTIFAMQGLGIIVALQYLFWIDSATPKAPPEFVYESGVGAIAGDILVLAINGVGLFLFLIAVGFLLKPNWVRPLGFVIACMLGFAFFLAVVSMLQLIVLQGAFLPYNLALVILFVTLAAADGIAIYLLAFTTRSQSKTLNVGV